MGGLTPDQVEALRAAVATGYLPTVSEAAKRLTAPFWWYDPDALPTERVRGGTICFLHTGERLVGVTAAHIHTSFLSKRAVTPDLWCQIGGHTFDPESRLNDLDEEIDLAVYDLSEIQVNAARADIHYPSRWPPESREGDICLVGGWPWMLSEEGSREVTHVFLHFITLLSTVSDRNLGLVAWTSTSVPWGGRALPPGTNLGGMSGGPIFRLPDEGLAVLELIGFVYEYHQSTELIAARPGSLITADGRLRKWRDR